MSQGTHTYACTVAWTGNQGAGTASYRAYDRSHVIRSPGKPDLLGSSDPSFRGDASRYNPEDLLVASLSCCHMLWYLHLASEARVVVTAYEDDPCGTMIEDAGLGGWFTGVTLHPRVTITRGSDPERARALHEAAHSKCFIANSVNFPVTCEPVIKIG